MERLLLVTEVLQVPSRPVRPSSDRFRASIPVTVHTTSEVAMIGCLSNPTHRETCAAKKEALLYMPKNQYNIGRKKKWNDHCLHSDFRFPGSQGFHLVARRPRRSAAPRSPPAFKRGGPVYLQRLRAPTWLLNMSWLPVMTFFHLHRVRCPVIPPRIESLRTDPADGLRNTPPGAARSPPAAGASAPWPLARAVGRAVSSGWRKGSSHPREWM